MSEVAQILTAAEQGDPRATEQLLPLVYSELRRLAAGKLATELPGHSLQATALVHEAFLRLVNVEKPLTWEGRGHFFAAAAEAMRRILVERARRRGRQKRGGGRRRIALNDVATIGMDAAGDPDDLLALDAALARLEADAPDKAQVVMLRYFAGQTLEEVAVTLGISLATVKRRWTYARAWLYGQLRNRDDIPDSPPER